MAHRPGSGASASRCNTTFCQTDPKFGATEHGPRRDARRPRSGPASGRPPGAPAHRIAMGPANCLPSAVRLFAMLRPGPVYGIMERLVSRPTPAFRGRPGGRSRLLHRTPWTNAKPSLEPRSHLVKSFRRLAFVCLALAAGLASIALPGRAQAPARNFAFADTTVLRDTLGLHF